MMAWSPTDVVLVITALGAIGVQLISAWRTSAKVSETSTKVSQVHDKVAVIEQHTNGMNTVLQQTKDSLAIELKALQAANLAALTEQRDRAQLKVAEQSNDMLRRADAATAIAEDVPPKKP